MTKDTGWRTTDGLFFSKKKEAMTHQRKLDAMLRLEQLVDRNVPYNEYKKQVQLFLEENTKELYEILKTIHG